MERVTFIAFTKGVAFSPSRTFIPLVSGSGHDSIRKEGRKERKGKERRQEEVHPVPVFKAFLNLNLGEGSVVRR